MYKLRRKLGQIRYIASDQLKQKRQEEFEQEERKKRAKLEEEKVKMAETKNNTTAEEIYPKPEQEQVSNNINEKENAKQDEQSSQSQNTLDLSGTATTSLSLQQQQQTEKINVTQLQQSSVSSEIKDDDSFSFPFTLPYRIIVAVASLSSIAIYDIPESVYPIAVVSGIHYEAITDITWSSDGQTLLVASKDGFCSSIHFEQNELGEQLSEEDYPPHMKSTVILENEEHDIIKQEKQKVSKQQQKEQRDKETSIEDIKDIDSGKNGVDTREQERVADKGKTNEASQEITGIAINEKLLSESLPPSSQTTNSSQGETTANTAEKKKRITPTLVQGFVQQNESKESPRASQTTPAKTESVPVTNNEQLNSHKAHPQQQTLLQFIKEGKHQAQIDSPKDAPIEQQHQHQQTAPTTKSEHDYLNGKEQHAHGTDESTNQCAIIDSNSNSMKSPKKRIAPTLVLSEQEIKNQKRRITPMLVQGLSSQQANK